MKISSIIKRALLYIVRGVPTKVVHAEICYTHPHHRLQGKKIIITGGGSGLGEAMAQKFMSEGAKVLIAGRNEEVLQLVAQRLGCHYQTLDVTRPENFDTFIQEAARQMDGLTSLVNNAGISLHESSFFEVTPQGFDAQFDTNFRGAFFLTQAFLRYITAHHQKAAILCISSETGDTADMRPYGFTKASMNSMVEGLAYLFKADEIRINAVSPGVTASKMTGFSTEGNLYLAGNATERVYLPEEVAEVASFLLSDASGSVSGQIITTNNAKTINARWR